MQKVSRSSQKVSPPSTVPGASMRPMTGMPRARVPGLVGGLFAPAIRLPRAEQDRAAVGDQRRVEGVAEVRVGGLDTQLVDPHPELAQRACEAIVLGLRTGQVHGPQEPVRRIVKGAPEGGSGALHQRIAQGRHEALGAEAAGECRLGHGQRG